MKKLLLGASALIMLTACGQEQATTEPAVDEAPGLRSGIDLAGMDTSVRPGDDFFAYVNGKWVAETEMPSDKSRYGTFDILRDESQENVRTIIEMSATGDFAKGSDEQKVGDLYKSYLDMDARNARGIALLQPELERIAEIANHSDVAVYFAGANRRGYGTPFAIAQFSDMKNPKYYGIYAFQSGHAQVGAPDLEYNKRA